MTKYQGFDAIMDDPEVPHSIKERLFRGGVRGRREEDLRHRLARHGYRLMSRGRGGQYWLISSDAMTLDEVEKWLDRT